MIEIRTFDSFGESAASWLESRHHFSFGHYYDPDRIRFGCLRVWNDDEIAPKSGFPMHPHESMEIVTYVREGAISHQDSLGNAGRTVAGDIQIMSAGAGISHSEWNAEDEVTKIFQLWFLPRKKGGTPRWETKTFPSKDASGFTLLASGIESGQPEVMFLNSDVSLYAGSFDSGQEITLPVKKEQKAYLVSSEGNLLVNGIQLNERDAALISDEDNVRVQSTTPTKMLLAVMNA